MPGGTEPLRTLVTAGHWDKDEVAELLCPTTEDKMLALEMPNHTASISYLSRRLSYSLRGRSWLAFYITKNNSAVEERDIPRKS